MWTQQLLVLFLRALLAARKSLNLYPPGSEMATAWVDRLHRSLDEFFRQGLTFPIRVGQDRFHWAGDDVLTVDPALEAFRFDLQARGIAAFSIDPAVEDWELQAFLELLNQAPEKLPSMSGAPAYLRERQVVRVQVETPGTQPGSEDTPESAWLALQGGKDALQLFVETILTMVDERFSDLTYDRTGLSRWFSAVAEARGVDALYASAKMLGAMADGGGDREVRTRTMLEAILELPESTLEPLLTKWLVPLAGSDLVAFNLLTQLTEDELAEVARHVPQEQLVALTTELLEFPWEEGKRQRLLEAVTWALRRHAGAETDEGSTPLLSRDDPVLLELRREIIESCQPDALLERSADVLLALVFDVESDEYPGSAVDALEEIVGEALARGRLPLAVRVLSRMARGRAGEDPRKEHARRVALFRRKVASRTHVSLVAGLLRHAVPSAELDRAAEYLRLCAREGAEEFVTLLADERDRRVRARMCQVLSRIGPPVLPALLPGLDDKRWYVVRNLVYVIGRIGHDSTFMAVAAALDHPHPRVRVEAIRAVGLVGAELAAQPIVRCVRDPDAGVRRAAVKALGTHRHEGAVPVLRDLVAAPVTEPADWDIKLEAIQALLAVGTPLATRALTAIARRRVWFWQRTERRIRDMAAAALVAPRGLTAPAVPETEDVD